MANQVQAAGSFHNDKDTKNAPVSVLLSRTTLSYDVDNFFHPFVGELAERLNKKSLPGLYDPLFLDTLRGPRSGVTSDSFFDFFGANYVNTSNSETVIEGHATEVDVSGGPYSNYNWELLFHVPLTIAVHLSKNQRFAEAQRWFHYIFDPTASESQGNVPERYWKFPAFRGAQPPLQIDRLLALLSKRESSLSADERHDRERVLEGVHRAIGRNPFQPHHVARTRPIAYQFNVVMKYLDNLIAWGDSLFRQDTIETINEATQRYILAANVLGQRPERIPERGAVRSRSFADLQAAGLDKTGNTLVDLESKFPFNLGLPSSTGTGASSGPLFGIGRTLYFCVPRNERLLGYWDTVADRLHKIRHCQNIEGVFRQLALFDPPIDPGMLVKAAAAGIDVGSMVRGLHQPLGPVRAAALIQKSLEICGEVRSLGAALLAAAERRDSEQLALIRQGHERRVQELTRGQRFLQLQQAKESTESLLSSRTASFERYRFYARLLGQPLDPALPPSFGLDRRTLTEENFDEAFASLVEQYDRQPAMQDLPALRLANGGAPGVVAGALGAGNLYLNSNEDLELNQLLPAATLARTAASIAELLAPVLVFIPSINVDLHYWGLGAHTEVFSGEKMSKAAKGTAELLKIAAALAQDAAGMAARTAGHQRRADEWINQYNLAALELQNNGRQVLTSLIAEQIAQREYESIVQQIENTREVDEFMQQKFTSEELHSWMQGEIARLYYDYYRLAFDTARRAELAMKRELMRPELDDHDFVEFNWDGGRKGLLAGETLHLAVKRMELAYLDNNRREFEITRNVSVRQIDPMALIALRATGRCDLNVPEWLFDLDCPGHYLRRIRSVSLSLPAIAGPQVGVHCTLSLLRSSVRVSPALKDNAYERQGLEDDRFANYFGAIQSVVTSTGSNDSGMFETNIRDDRLLPFEGCGTESTWRLELPADHRSFDYSTISDAILHIRYTARAGVSRNPVTQYLNTTVFALNAPTGLALLIDVRSEYAAEWIRFMAGGGTLDVRVGKERFPYVVQNVAGKTIQITGIDAIAADSVARHGVGDASAATTAFTNTGAFTLSLPADAVGAGAVLLRDAKVRPQLLVRYALV